MAVLLLLEDHQAARAIEGVDGLRRVVGAQVLEELAERGDRALPEPLVCVGVLARQDAPVDLRRPVWLQVVQVPLGFTRLPLRETYLAAHFQLNEHCWGLAELELALIIGAGANPKSGVGQKNDHSLNLPKEVKL